MNLKDLMQSHTYSRLIALLAILVAALVVFWAGTVVGYRQAAFSHQWDDNYAMQFGGPRSPFGMMSDGDDSTLSPHGAFGTVVGFNFPTMIVKGPSEAEKKITLNDSTVVRRFRSFATTTDIKPGETVVVIGEPDSQGGITASLIRIVPPQGSSTPQMMRTQLPTSNGTN